MIWKGKPKMIRESSYWIRDSTVKSTFYTTEYKGHYMPSLGYILLVRACLAYHHQNNRHQEDHTFLLNFLGFFACQQDQTSCQFHESLHCVHSWLEVYIPQCEVNNGMVTAWYLSLRTTDLFKNWLKMWNVVIIVDNDDSQHKQTSSMFWPYRHIDKGCRWKQRHSENIFRLPLPWKLIFKKVLVRNQT